MLDCSGASQQAKIAFRRTARIRRLCTVFPQAGRGSAAEVLSGTRWRSGRKTWTLHWRASTSGFGKHLCWRDIDPIGPEGRESPPISWRAAQSLSGRLSKTSQLDQRTPSQDAAMPCGCDRSGYGTVNEARAKPSRRARCVRNRTRRHGIRAPTMPAWSWRRARRRRVIAI